MLCFFRVLFLCSLVVLKRRLLSSGFSTPTPVLNISQWVTMVSGLTGSLLVLPSFLLSLWKMLLTQVEEGAGGETFRAPRVHWEHFRSPPSCPLSQCFFLGNCLKTVSALSVIPTMLLSMETLPPQASQHQKHHCLWIADLSSLKLVLVEVTFGKKCVPKIQCSGIWAS